MKLRHQFLTYLFEFYCFILEIFCRHYYWERKTSPLCAALYSLFSCARQDGGRSCLVLPPFSLQAVNDSWATVFGYSYVRKPLVYNPNCRTKVLSSALCGELFISGSRWSLAVAGLISRSLAESSAFTNSSPGAQNTKRTLRRSRRGVFCLWGSQPRVEAAVWE